MRYAWAGAHELDLTGLQLTSVAQAILVLKSAFEHVAEYLHVTVRVGSKALAGRDAIIVYDSQGPETHVCRIVIIRKREGVK